MQDGKRYLNYISQMAKAKNVNLTTELVKGVVNKEVIRKVGEWRIDLLIMGELEPILSRTDAYHDETELIFRKAPCSVLVVKDAERAEKLYQSLKNE
jgi:nucleotide-binding universal stress UspA family protein